MYTRWLGRNGYAAHPDIVGFSNLSSRLKYPIRNRRMMIVDLLVVRITSKPLFVLKLSFTSTTHFIHSVSILTLNMSTATTITTLEGTLRFPAHSLLSLASQIVRLLNAHYTQQYETALTAGDDSEVESVENLTDVQITLQQLDPVYWKELADKRLQSTGKSLLLIPNRVMLSSKLNFHLTST